MDRKSRGELRCYCSRRPLLALYGLDAKGELFLHVKVYKGDRIYGEMILSRGDVLLRCRECLRWHRVFMRGRAPVIRETVDPTKEG